jgi:hypothetical protein
MHILVYLICFFLKVEDLRKKVLRGLKKVLTNHGNTNARISERDFPSKPQFPDNFP